VGVKRLDRKENPMPKKTNLTDAQKVDVVLRLLRKEEPASAGGTR
jgi:hypothetical protein